ncbi:MAG TPA: hypothetical protein VGN13_05445 [Solirubrobacteraceae bacterium]|jgi:hypothetical protein
MHVAPSSIAGGWQGAPGARVRVGGAPASSSGYQSPSAAFAWQPPPVPAGYYNPILDIQQAEGKQGSEQQLTGLERQQTVDENTYATNLGLLGQREAQQQEAQKQTLARLAESYAKLGTRQGEQANRLGVVNGGALISSATNRAANEAVQKAADERTFAAQGQANENERGKLATQQSQLTGPGGTLVEAIANNKQNQQLFEQGIGTLRSSQAAEHGYVPPQRPWVHERGGSVRVGGKY